MSLHVEISGDATRLEWASLAVLAAAMLSNDEGRAAALETLLIDGEPPVAEGGPVSIVPKAVPVTPALSSEARDLADQIMAQESARVAASEQPEELPAIVPPPGVELDAEGLPHDLRIHAATKSQTKEKRWTKKRGVDPALVTAVEAELRKVLAAPAIEPDGPAMSDPAAAFGAPTPTANVPPPPVGVGATIPVPPPPVGNSEPTTPSAAPVGNAFAALMQKIVTKGISTPAATELAQSLGLTSIRDFATRPDLIPAFEALLP